MIRERASVLRYTHVACLVVKPSHKTCFCFEVSGGVNDVSHTQKNQTVMEKVNVMEALILVVLK
jgi:hypothetical protein